MLQTVLYRVDAPLSAIYIGGNGVYLRNLPRVVQQAGDMDIMEVNTSIFQLV